MTKQREFTIETAEALPNVSRLIMLHVELVVANSTFPRSKLMFVQAFSEQWVDA